MSSYLPLLWRDCGAAFWVGCDDALRCGGGHNNGAARLLGADAFRSVDLVHSNQLNFMLLTNIILLTIIDLILFRYYTLIFFSGVAVLFAGVGAVALLLSGVLTWVVKKHQLNFINNHRLNLTIIDLILFNRLKINKLKIININLCRNTLFFFFGVAVLLSVVLVCFLVLLPFGVLTWFTVINLILCC